jgi:hypothetical protein
MADSGSVEGGVVIAEMLRDFVPWGVLLYVFVARLSSAESSGEDVISSERPHSLKIFHWILGSAVLTFVTIPC